MVLPGNTITQSAKATKRFGAEFGHTVLKSGIELPNVLCLWGELGSGKTTFTQGLAKGFGITSRLLSPTFIIVRRYDIPKTEKVLYHLDLYRMQGNADIEGLGFTDMLTDPNAFVVIEWPELLENFLPEKRIDIRFGVLSSGDHEITIRS